MPAHLRPMVLKNMRRIMQPRPALLQLRLVLVPAALAQVEALAGAALKAVLPMRRLVASCPQPLAAVVDGVRAEGALVDDLLVPGQDQGGWGGPPAGDVVG
jgi:hypothetical protein